MENEQKSGELLQAGVNVHLDIPKTTWLWLGGTVVVAGGFLILLGIFKKKI